MEGIGREGRNGRREIGEEGGWGRRRIWSGVVDYNTKKTETIFAAGKLPSEHLRGLSLVCALHPLLPPHPFAKI